jgi:DDE superfamily endonuclease
MVKDFNAQTREKANGDFWVLLMDGHSSHYTLEILQYTKDNKIIILGYPLHCTHVLQGLDVVCFAKMKSEFRREIQAFEDLHFLYSRLPAGCSVIVAHVTSFETRDIT